MGRYKGKRLKQDTGVFQSMAQRMSAFRDGKKPGAAAPVQKAPAQKAPAQEAPVQNAPAQVDNAAPRQGKSKAFLTGLTLYGVILLAITGILQITLWQYLGNSQAEMDRQAAERAAQQAHEKALRQAAQLAFEDWQSGITADYWTDLWYTRAPDSLDARESVREVMEERFAPGAVEAYKAAGFTHETPVYVLKNGADSLARVTLAGSGLNWSVSEVELLIEGACSACVTVADGCHVYCNGTQLGGEYAEAAESRFRCERLEGQLEGAVAWVSYSVEGLLLEPELTVEPPEGYSVIQTEEGEYLLGLAGNTGAYADRAVGFVRAYLNYYMSGYRDTRYNYNLVLNYLTYGTLAYQDVADAYEGVSWSAAYTGIDTSKTYAGDVIAWADNCFSVDVTYNADCIWYGQPVDYADATMRIYFLRTGSGYIISNFETL